MGKNDIEDALKKLDRLTQEEARMASAQLLKITNAIDEHVADVDGRVAGVDERVAGVGDRVKDVDDKLVAVIDGAQYVLTQSSKFDQLLMRVDGKETRGVIQRAADGVDRIERSWLPNRILLDMQAQPSLQGINYNRNFVDGSRHRIHLRITISRTTRITRERRPGFSKEGRIMNGSQQVPTRSSGFMGNVRCLILLPSTLPDNIP